MDRGGFVSTLVAYWVLTISALLVVGGLKYRFPETLLILASTAVSLIALEVGLRLWYPPSWQSYVTVPSPRYHHIPLPNKSMYLGKYEGGESVIVTTNEDGLRSRHDRASFRLFRHRVIAMGDSFTFGIGVKQSAVFPQQIEALLRNRLLSEDVAVLNAGIVSYSPFLSRLLFRGVLKSYRPTLVLYFLDATDFSDDLRYMSEVRTDREVPYFDREYQTPRYHGAISKLLWNAGLTDLIRRPFDLLSKSHGRSERFDYYDFEVSIDGVKETSRFFFYRYPPELTKPFFEQTYQNIIDLAEDVRRDGGRFLLVVTPRYHHWNTREAPENWEKHEYGTNEPYQYEYLRFFDEKKSDAQLEIFDLLPAFQATDQFPLVFRGDPHWNERGHTFVANVIVDHLLAGFLLQDTQP
jgi:hypothetical protein